MLEYAAFLLLQAIQKLGRYLFEVGPSFLLSGDAYGEYAYLVSLGMLLGTAATLGTPLSLLRIIPESLAQGRREHLVAATTRLVFASFLVLAMPLAVWLLSRHTVAATLATVGFVLAYALTNSLATFFRAQQRVKSWFFYQEMVMPIGTVLVVGVGTLMLSRDSFTAAAILGTAVFIGILTVLAIGHQLRQQFIIRIDGIGITALDRQVLAVSLPMFFTGFTYMLLARIDVILLERFVQRDELGAYNIIVRTCLQVAVLWQLLSSYYVPRIGKLFAEADDRSAARLNQRFTLLSVASTVVLTLAFIIIVYAARLHDYLPVWNDDLEIAFLLVLLGQLFAVCFSSYGYILLFIKKESLNYLNSAVVITLNVGLNILLIPILGVKGAALATLIALAMMKVMETAEVYYFRRTLYLR